MDTEQVETLSKRLREIGFSDRAVSMIVEQVIQLELRPNEPDGLAETAAVFESVERSSSAMETERVVPNDIKVLATLGTALTLVSIWLGWSAMTSAGQGELAIMAGTPSGSTWLQGIQALLLAGWVALPPLLSVFKGNASTKLKQVPLLAVWGGIGLTLATLLLASAG